MKTFSIQHALFPLLLLLSGSSYWFLQARSSALQTYKDNQVVTYPMLQEDNSRVFLSSSPDQLEADQQQGLAAEDGKEQEFQEDQDLLPDVQLLKFILDKSKEGLPVLRLPAFLYR